MESGAELYAIFLGPLEDLELPYFITGSVASSAYGEPRFTQDLDLVIALGSSSVASLISAFPAEHFYVPPREALDAEASRPNGGHFNLIHHELGLRADVYLAGDDELHAWGFENRRRIELREGLSVWLAAPEYVILRKLEYMAEGGGERHLGDIRAMIAILGPELDTKFLHARIARSHLEAGWRQVTG